MRLTLALLGFTLDLSREPPDRSLGAVARSGGTGLPLLVALAPAARSRTCE
jgi:hypothetical protein